MLKRNLITIFSMAIIVQVTWTSASKSGLILEKSVDKLAHGLHHSIWPVILNFNSENDAEATNTVDDFLEMNQLKDDPFPVMVFDWKTSEANYWSIMGTLRSDYSPATSVNFINKTDAAIEFLRRIKIRNLNVKDVDAGRQDLIYHDLWYIFLFPSRDLWLNQEYEFERELTEEMNVIAIVLVGDDEAEIWYARDIPDGANDMKVVNIWTSNAGFSLNDSLVPMPESVYKQMGGRKVPHPVMHKPPWNYVTLDEDDNFVEDNGGRDVTLLGVIAHKMNFTFESFDPQVLGVKRSRGSSWSKPDYSFSGILGALHKREDNFTIYLGDTTQTYERNSAVEFSFFVLFDSGAFVTRAPTREIPDTIVFMPFSLVVWQCLIFSVTAMLATIIAAVFIIPVGERRSVSKWLRYCSGFIIRSLLEQEIPKKFKKDDPISTKISFVVWMVVCAWIFSPSYSGTLFSFFSVPFSAKPLNSLEELEDLQAASNMTVGMTEGSSTQGVFKNGDGVYAEIWARAEERNNWKIDSVGQGLQRVLKEPNFAVVAGREKLIFDTQLLGKDRFHVNEKLFFPKYKGVAMRKGSPFRDPIDLTLLRLYDSGIINKITQDEYLGITRRIGDHGKAWEQDLLMKKRSSRVTGESRMTKLDLNQLFMVFIILVFGLGLGTLVFLLETCTYFCYRITTIKNPLAF